MRDRWEEYQATGAEVVGLSPNTVESHQKFTEHHKLPLRLLADTNSEVAKLYGASSWIPGRTARAVVVIDGAGVIRYRKVQPLSLFRPKDDEVIAAIRAAGAASNAASR